MKLSLGTALLILILTACGSNKEIKGEDSAPDLRFLNCRNDDGAIPGIVKGTEVALQDPHVKLAVLLMIDNGRNENGDQISTTCTGTPISDRVILTAAHCVKGVGKRDVHAVFHNNIKCSSGYNRETMTISSIDVVVNSGYQWKPEAKDDLALIKLASPIPSSYPIATLYDGRSPLSSDDVLMIGYGVTKEWRKDQRVLRKTIKSFKNDAYILDNNIAFNQSNGTGGVCSGDSGGPVYVMVQGRYQIIGINSVVQGASEFTACHESSVALYAPYYIPWIQTELSKIQ